MRRVLRSKKNYRFNLHH